MQRLVTIILGMGTPFLVGVDSFEVVWYNFAVENSPTTMSDSSEMAMKLCCGNNVYV